MVKVDEKPVQRLYPQLQKILDREQEREPNDYVLCDRCEHVLTQRSQAIEVNGSHTHICVNPHGFEFHLGSYAEALGCGISGARTHADTWFAGYKWRFATCEACQQHLGWYFDCSEHYFYGLIFDRIRSV